MAMGMGWRARLPVGAGDGHPGGGKESVVAKADIAALLALSAAFFIALGDVIQERCAHDVTDEPVGRLELLRRLIHDRRWWLGSVVGIVGFVCQAAALGLGSVLMVQALLVTSLLFALPMNARANGQSISAAQGTWAVLLAAAITVIVTVGNPAPGQARGTAEVWLTVLAVLGPGIVLCIVGSRMLAGGPTAAVLMGVVAGSLWGVFAILTKGVVDRLSHGLWAVLGAPELYIWAAVTVAALAWEQSAFRAGSLSASLPAMTVAEPIVASLLGILVLGETLHPGDRGWALLIGAVAVMVVATVALARSGAVTRGDARSDSPAPAGR